MASEAQRFTVPEALVSLGEVARRDDSLKARTEGLTWVLWGMAIAGSTLTYVATLTPEGLIPPWAPFVATLWAVAALVATVGLWRSAAVSFDTGMTAKRTAAFFLGWSVLATLLVMLILVPTGDSLGDMAQGTGLGVQAKLLATGILLVGFGLLNPLGFTPMGRRVGLAHGAVAVAAGAYGLAAGMSGESGILYVGAVLGVSWVLGGLHALYRG